MQKKETEHVNQEEHPPPFPTRPLPPSGGLGALPALGGRGGVVGTCSGRITYCALASDAGSLRGGKELGQRAMYFEVRDYDGVQILEMPAD